MSQSQYNALPPYTKAYLRLVGIQERAEKLILRSNFHHSRYTSDEAIDGVLISPAIGKVLDDQMAFDRCVHPKDKE